jgi:hypothetical protein
MSPSCLRDRLAEYARQSPLVASTPTLAALPDSLSVPSTASVYFGVGLTGRRSVSRGLPFDVLGMVCAAEQCRQRVGAEVVYCLVADAHAFANPFVLPDEAEAHAAFVEKTLSRTAERLGLPLEVVSASALEAQDPLYGACLARSSDENDYLRREAADILYFRTERGLAVKLGWALEKKGFDERVFDAHYLSLFPADAPLFVYTTAGRRLGGEPSAAPPYLCDDAETRILLHPGEDAARKLSAVGDGGEKARTHLTAVVEAVSTHLSLPDSEPLEAKIRFINESIFG